MNKANRTERLGVLLMTLLLSGAFWALIICSAISTIKVIILISIIFTCVTYCYSYILIKDVKKTIFLGSILIIITAIICILIFLIKDITI